MFCLKKFLKKVAYFMFLTFLPRKKAKTTQQSSFELYKHVIKMIKICKIVLHCFQTQRASNDYELLHIKLSMFIYTVKNIQ